ncbi:hypothetical protein [Pseudarthrobacter sp. MDT3-1]
MFQSKAASYQHNMMQAERFRANPALLTAPSGEQEPAVVIRSAGKIQGVIPIAAALRLANQLADSVDAHTSNTNSRSN